MPQSGVHMLARAPAQRGVPQIPAASLNPKPRDLPCCKALRQTTQTTALQPQASRRPQPAKEDRRRRQPASLSPESLATSRHSTKGVTYLIKLWRR